MERLSENMRQMAMFWLMLTSFLWTPSALAQLTEGDVEQLLVDIEAADQRRDVPFVLETLAEDVIIVFRYTALGDIPDMRFNKTQYRDFLVSAYGAVESHSSRRFGTKITISDDGQSAEVFANVEETSTMQGKTSVYVSRQTVLIRFEEGRARVKRVFAELLKQADDT
jgi:hypothetical protein